MKKNWRERNIFGQYTLWTILIVYVHRIYYIGKPIDREMRQYGNIFKTHYAMCVVNVWIFIIWYIKTQTV